MSPQIYFNPGVTLIKVNLQIFHNVFSISRMRATFLTQGPFSAESGIARIAFKKAGELRSKSCKEHSFEKNI